MVTQGVLGVIGFSSGLAVAGGVIALLIGLGVLSRYAGLTRTASHLWLYEDTVLLGGIFGNWLTVYHPSCPLGGAALAVLGLFFGIFVGSWIMALAEIINMLPILARRIGLVKGMSIVAAAIAAGKTLGSLWHFFQRW